MKEMDKMIVVFQAGQATEPECMISSCLIAGKEGQVSFSCCLHFIVLQ